MGFFDRFKKSSDSKNFKYLDKLIHNGVKEIVLDSDIVLGGRDEKKYFEGIKLDIDDLTIDGNGHIIDAKGKTRIFYCTGNNITIKNITLKNGFAEEYGGAIYNNGRELTITSSTLKNNSTKYGGAIWNCCELTITKCIFNKNSVSMSGGAIFNEDNNLSIFHSTFTENTASFGGAIMNKSKLCIFESMLNNNRTNGSINSGVIDNKGILTISKSTLQNNITKNGGAVHNNDGGKISITDSILNNNSTTDSSTGTGAISNSSAELTITKSILNNNEAKGKYSSGAIENSLGGVVNIIESKLNNNFANGEYSSGAIKNSLGGVVNIIESKLNNNFANGEYSIGTILNDKGNFKIFNCEFSSNKSPNDIILNNDSLQIHNTSFRCNQSKHIVLNDGDGANLGIFNGEFKENNIEKSILCNDGKFCIVEKTVFQNNISNNEMNIINESEMTLTNPKIKDKRKSVLNQKYILIKNSPPELENKICGEGAVEIDEQIIPQRENFDFKYLDKKIHESKTNEIILDHDITFENYERDFYEGGIELDIDDLIINGNGHTIDGADKSRIFIITGKNITLKNIIFKNGHSHKNYGNKLNNNAGAIKINHNNNVTIENCEFINNISEEDGGAIYNNGKLRINDSTLTGNMAKQYGGAIYNDESGELTITESALYENTSQSRGGAIYNDGGECNISSSTFENNTHGAIANSGNMIINHSTLNNNALNIPYANGGAIGNSGKMIINHSTLNNNNSSIGRGGAIGNSGEMSIIISIFQNNHAYMDGGAIFNSSSECSIIKSTFTNNMAKKNGGAICETFRKINLDECNFKDNTPNDIDTW